MTDVAGWRGHDRGTPEYRRIVIALGFAGVATFAQLYSPQGILPLVARDLHVTAAQSALLISAATIGLAVGVLPWSWLAGRIGCLPAMRIALVAAVVFGSAVVVVPGFEAVLVLRVLEGLALGGVPALAITYLHEEVRASHTVVAAATYVSGTTIGGLLGRIVAAPFAELGGWRLGVGVVLALCAVATVGFVLITPKPFGSRRSEQATLVWAAKAALANLRNVGMLVLFAQAFLLMGGFVTVYNYLAFRLEAPPFELGAFATSLLFLAYLAGTYTSRQAGGSARRFGRRAVLLTGIAVMIAGALLTLATQLVAVIVGLVVFTGGFFAAHAIASGWVGARATVGRAQAASLYNVFYYLGSSLIGWVGGFVYGGGGWSATIALVAGLAVLAAALVVVYAFRSRRAPAS
ncbi:MFS transporter [Planctomonas sp. JC2975]|uniref:MFS transporter n=1 Tax=Planctomonas sp. JC2975 TaxID=2729626 RepID=UPI0014738784|nr:MFS transporter [Planctomonas sp. JC2975]NNC11384.1 MFS transporter [Planctomonas sp. JC2975]